jgi:hypothetical protein
VYALAEDLREYGAYRYGYVYSGPLASGPFRIQSQTRTFQIEPPWLLVAAAAGLSLVLLELLSLFTAKLRGQIQVDKKGQNPNYATLSVRPRSTLHSSAIRDIDLGAARFQVRARRHLFLHKRLCITVDGVEATLDNVKLKKGGQKCVLPRGKHMLRFNHADGSQVEAQLSLRM